MDPEPPKSKRRAVFWVCVISLTCLAGLWVARIPTHPDRDLAAILQMAEDSEGRVIPRSSGVDLVEVLGDLLGRTEGLQDVSLGLVTRDPRLHQLPSLVLDVELKLVENLYLFGTLKVQLTIEVGKEPARGCGHTLRRRYPPDVPSVCATRLTALVNEAHSLSIASRRARPLAVM